MENKSSPEAIKVIKRVYKDNGMAVIQKNNGDEYPYVAICCQQEYVAQKIQNKLVDYPNAQLVVLAKRHQTPLYITTGCANEAVLLRTQIVWDILG